MLGAQCPYINPLLPRPETGPGEPMTKPTPISPPGREASAATNEIQDRPSHPGAPKCPRVGPPTSPPIERNFMVEGLGVASWLRGGTLEDFADALACGEAASSTSNSSSL